MSEALSPELEAQAQALAARIRSRSADAILAMARRLVATTDETLFGETEFALSDRALGLVGDAYAEPLEQKGATSARAPSAAAAAPPASTATAPKRSRATGPTPTAASAAKAPAPGTPRSG